MKVTKKIWKFVKNNGDKSLRDIASMVQKKFKVDVSYETVGWLRRASSFEEYQDGCRERSRAHRLRVKERNIAQQAGLKINFAPKAIYQKNRIGWIRKTIGDIRLELNFIESLIEEDKNK